MSDRTVPAGRLEFLPMPPPRILVLEDSILVAMALQAALEDRGHAVVSAGSLAAAHAALEDGPVVAALLDLHLPGGDSSALAVFLHQSGCHVAILTGAADDLSGELAAVPRFVKPTAFEEIVAWLDQRLAPPA